MKLYQGKMYVNVIFFYIDINVSDEEEYKLEFVKDEMDPTSVG